MHQSKVQLFNGCMIPLQKLFSTPLSLYYTADSPPVVGGKRGGEAGFTQASEL